MLLDKLLLLFSARPKSDLFTALTLPLDFGLMCNKVFIHPVLGGCVWGGVGRGVEADINEAAGPNCV